MRIESVDPDRGRKKHGNVPWSSESIFFMKSESRRLWALRVSMATLHETAQTAKSPTPPFDLSIYVTVLMRDSLSLSSSSLLSPWNWAVKIHSPRPPTTAEEYTAAVIKRSMEIQRRKEEEKEHLNSGWFFKEKSTRRWNINPIQQQVLGSIVREEKKSKLIYFCWINRGAHFFPPKKKFFRIHSCMALTLLGKRKKIRILFPPLRFRLASVFGSHAYFFFREKKVVGKDRLK